MKGATTVSVFVPTSRDDPAVQAKMIDVLSYHVLQVFYETSKKYREYKNDVAEIVFEGGAKYSGKPGLWVHITSTVSGITGPVSAYVETLITTNMNIYYELVAGIMTEPTDKPTPLPAFIQSGK